MTMGWVFDYAVANAVEGVALSQYLVVDPCLPCLRGDEIWSCGRAGDGVESSAPGIQVVEIDAGSAGYDAVEIERIHFGGFDALSAAEGTA
jgi:hypothetical protein